MTKCEVLKDSLKYTKPGELDNQEKDESHQKGDIIDVAPEEVENLVKQHIVKEL